jgi:hypothetical protein
MDEAWELLNRDPPLVWRIKIKELPEERIARTSWSLVYHITIAVADSQEPSVINMRGHAPC